ncbi:hypothetical protein [Tessaracoccus sp. Y1736]
MTTTVPSFTKDITQTFLASTLAVTLLILLVWMFIGITGAVTNLSNDTPLPSPQAQIAPQPAQAPDPTIQQ